MLVKAAIVNYGVGNLFSIRRACEINGIDASVTSSAKDIETAAAVILPGVGAFAAAMENLKKMDLLEPVKSAALSGKPFVGICLGYQLLFEKSYEFGEHEGLGILRGDVVRIPRPDPQGGDGLKIPNVCWNKVFYSSANTNAADIWPATLLDGIPSGSYMYFVHSYIARPVETNIMIASTNYGDMEFCSAVAKENLFACQFHPERSGAAGLKLYANLRRKMAKTE